MLAKRRLIVVASVGQKEKKKGKKKEWAGVMKNK